MKLSIVIPVLNQLPLARATYSQLRKVTAGGPDVEFIIIDNGSMPQAKQEDFEGAFIAHNPYSIGVYPTFKQGFDEATGDVVAFFHSDVAVWEMNWNKRVMEAFETAHSLGMVGFIGSNEIDGSGGRGLGTTSNFKGLTLLGASVADTSGKMETYTWVGSHARVHGKESDGVSRAAVVDGCVMIIRRKA